MPCRAVPCRAVPCRAVRCGAVRCGAVLCCAVLCCAVLCFALELRHVALYCVTVCLFYSLHGVVMLCLCYPTWLFYVGLCYIRTVLLHICLTAFAAVELHQPPRLRKCTLISNCVTVCPHTQVPALMQTTQFPDAALCNRCTGMRLPFQVHYSCHCLCSRYGDIHATTLREKWFSVLAMLVGIALFFGLILGGMASMLTNLDSQRARYIHHLSVIKDHMVST